jgi:hypothetical protein
VLDGHLTCGKVECDEAGQRDRLAQAFQAKREAFIHTARTEVRICPACSAQHDAATGVSLEPGDTHPELRVGNLTACSRCGTILIVTTIGWRPATDEEIDRLDPDLKRLLREFVQTRTDTRVPRS